MNKYNQFKELTKQAAERFRKTDKKETIKIVSHLDCDGICASAILIKALENQNRKYTISIIPQLTDKILDSLAEEPCKIIIFTDLGSGMVSKIKDILPKKEVFILDHHELNSQGKKTISNITHVNPHLFGIDGGKEISGAGVVYFFAEELDKKNQELAHIAIIGAIGDIQENNGFPRLNNEILETAIKQNKLLVKKGLRLFGMQTRPLHKVLEYSSDPYIPGVSGSESGAIQFLHNLKINPKNGDNWKKMIHLDNKDTKKLVTGVIMARINEETPEDVLGNIYLLKEEAEESPLKDAKEFSTLLNACGRMEKASLGIGACLGNKKSKKHAINHLTEYRKEIVNSMRWFNNNKGTENIIENTDYMIIKAEGNIKSTIIGTLASIISKSNRIKPGIYIISLAHAPDNTIKASIRISGIKQNKRIDLKEVIDSITAKVPGSSAGGHSYAAGAVIPMEKENEFIEAAKEVLSKTER